MAYDWNKLNRLVTDHINRTMNPETPTYTSTNYQNISFNILLHYKSKSYFANSIFWYFVDIFPNPTTDSKVRQRWANWEPVVRCYVFTYRASYHRLFLLEGTIIYGSVMCRHDPWIQLCLHLRVCVYWTVKCRGIMWGTHQFFLYVGR